MKQLSKAQGSIRGEGKIDSGGNVWYGPVGFAKHKIPRGCCNVAS